MLPVTLHTRVRQEQEKAGMTLGEYVEAMITEYYDWKDGKIMTGEMRTLAAQIPAELFDRLDRYLKERGIKKKDFLVDIITRALEEAEAAEPVTEASPQDELEEQPEAQFELVADGKGTIVLDVVSLFPPTFKNRENGLRPDLAQLLYNIHPKFVRFPGGCYVEGIIFLAFTFLNIRDKILECIPKNLRFAISAGIYPSQHRSYLLPVRFHRLLYS